MRTIKTYDGERVTLPPDCVPVLSGEVLQSDLLYDEIDGWEQAAPGEIGSPVNAFIAVARRKVRELTTTPKTQHENK